MLTKRKIISALIMNIAVITGTVAVVISYFFRPENGTLMNSGWESFRFFTTDSNILSAMGSAVLAVCEIKALKSGVYHLNKNAVLLKYAGTMTVAVTFGTVMLFLGPLYGYPLVLGGTGFYMHVVGPLLALISLCFLETEHIIPKRAVTLGVLPVAIYAAVYFVEVIVIGSWRDFYGFNIGGMWYVSIISMLSATLVLCVLVRLLHNRFAKTNPEILAK